MYRWCETRYREEEREDGRRGSREDCNEGIKGCVPESKGSTMCLTLFKSKLWIEAILTIEMIAVVGEEGGECRACITLKHLGFGEKY